MPASGPDSAQGAETVQGFLKRLLGRADPAPPPPPQPPPLAFVFMPALRDVLAAVEQAQGRPLTREEVLDLRDRATCMAVPAATLADHDARRGFADLRPDHVWEDWQAHRHSGVQAP